MTSIAKEVVLVTGANSGIGFELARQLLAKGTYHVLLGARSPQRGASALQDLESRNLPGSVELLHLDVCSDSSIAAAATSISNAHGRLDVLVNNAAVASFSDISRDMFRDAFDTNATGPYLLSKALIGLLKKSPNPRIVNVASGAGSIGRRLTYESPMYKIQAEPYRASKVAMNMLTTCLFVEFGLGFGQDPRANDGAEEGEDTVKSAGDSEGSAGQDRKIKVFAYDPGFTVSNLSEFNKKEHGARSAEESVWSLMDVVEGKRDDEVGRFIHNTGGFPW